MKNQRLPILLTAGVFVGAACASTAATSPEAPNVKRAVGGLRIVHNPAAIQREQEQRDRDRDERRRAEQLRLEEDRRAEEQRRIRSDNVAWVDARRDECERALSLEACRGVELYLATFPEGQHATEAKEALDQSRPRLAQLQQDEVDWVKADPRSCEGTPSAATCVSICSYLGRHGGGLHAADARMLLDAAGMNPQECL